MPLVFHNHMILESAIDHASVGSVAAIAQADARVRMWPIINSGPSSPGNKLRSH
jgi:hypothetical protein